MHKLIGKAEGKKKMQKSLKLQKLYANQKWYRIIASESELNIIYSSKILSKKLKVSK